MRVTIIPQDGKVVIDGKSYDGINLSSIDPNIHAIQWYDTYGEIEILDSRGNHAENQEITSFDNYLFVVDLWKIADDEQKKKELEFKAALEAKIGQIL